jgi:hypothetical protein
MDPHAARAAPARKRILAPDGSELTPSTKPQPDGALVKALARAWRWQRLLDSGVCVSVTEIAEAEKISKSYVSRILRLALLAPDLVEAIPAGGAGHETMLAPRKRPLPISVGQAAHPYTMPGPVDRLAGAWGVPAGSGRSDGPLPRARTTQG